MESNTLPLTKEKLGQVINQQLYTINCLVNERIWLTEQLSMYHDTIIQWQQYAQSLETDLQRRQKEQAKVEEAHSQLDIKYQDLKWIYWQVNRKYEKCKAEFKYGMEVGESVCAEYLYYKQSYTELLEHYRQLWSACYARPSGSGQEQERSDHGTAQKSTAVLPLNLKSRKIRSSPSKGEVPPLAFPCIMSFKEDNITSPGLRSKPGQAAVIHLFPNQSVLDSLGLKRKAVRSLQSPPEAPPIVDIKQENSSHLLPCAISSVRFSSDKLEELELPQFEDKSSSIFPKAPSSVDLAKDELEVVEALQLPEKTVGLTKAKLEVAESPQLKIEYWSSFCYEEDYDECEPHSENAKATEVGKEKHDNVLTGYQYYCFILNLWKKLEQFSIDCRKLLRDAGRYA